MSTIESDLTVAVWKYDVPLPDGSISYIEMPRGATILSAQAQEGRPYLWALVDRHQPLVKRAIAIIMTGEKISQHVLAVRPSTFISTVQLGQLVLHLFDFGET